MKTKKHFVRKKEQGAVKNGFYSPKVYVIDLIAVITRSALAQLTELGSELDANVIERGNLAVLVSVSRLSEHAFNCCVFLNGSLNTCNVGGVNKAVAVNVACNDNGSCVLAIGYGATCTNNCVCCKSVTACVFYCNLCNEALRC